MYDILDTINSPADVKKLAPEQLKQLCSQVREYIVECCSRNPGHLGSSLGAVEITVGLHYAFNTPEDKIVFDVGHQAYAHKILTGRREAFRQIRTKDGISGFPKRSESEYDAFGVGHSSTSISAALGFAEAAKLQGRKSRAVAVIGDGALTGGLALEGLNNAGDSKADILVILNDNNQSIDKNLGALHRHLLKITTSATYNRVKGKLWEVAGEGKFRSFVQSVVRTTKSFLVKKQGGDLFEALGFRYFGPIDGNDMDKVVETLQRIREIKGPRILHCITKKGKGYAPAEQDPTVWHAPGRFDPATGERLRAEYAADRYQDVFGEVLCELAKNDSRVVGITPAMSSGCGMGKYAQLYPERFFDVGIEEEHAVTFSAGLAAGGMRPFCNIYSSFSQRAYDQIIHDVALQRLPVVLCFDRAGLVGEDGATHQGAFDIAAYRSIPNAVIAVPKDELELKQMMYGGLLAEHGPYIIRYPRGTAEGTPWRDAAFEQMPVGKAEILQRGEKICLIAAGHCANRALEAAQAILEEKGITLTVYNARFVKPLDEEMVQVAASHDLVISIEDGTLAGGLYGALCEKLAGYPRPVRVRGLGMPDSFMEQDSQKNQREICGLDAESIRKILADELSVL